MSKRETPTYSSRLQKPGTSISRTNQSQITRTDSGTIIEGNSRISQTTIRPSGCRAAGSSNVASAITGAAKVRMVGAPSTSRTQSGVRSQQVTQVKLSGLPGKPIAKTKVNTAAAAKGKAGTCPATCSNQSSAPGPFTAEVEAGKHVPPGLYFHPMKGKVTEDVNSPEKLRWKLAKYTPTSLSHYKVENVHPFKQDLAPLRKQHPDIVSGVFRSLYDLPDTNFESVEQLRQQRILNQAMNPYMPENDWTVGLREAMDLGQGEMETEDGVVEFEQSTIERRIDGQLGSPGRSPESLCPPCAPEVCDSSPEIIESSSSGGRVQQRSPTQDYISPPRQDIMQPETHYHLEQRIVSPARIDSPAGPIEARQTFHVERQMGASPHGAVVDTTMIGTRIVSSSQAQQIEITKRDRIPPPKTPPSASKRQSPLVSPGRYPSPLQFQSSSGRPQLESPSRYPSPPQFHPSPNRPELGSPAYSDLYAGSPSRYPSPLQFQPSQGRPQLESPSRYPSPPQFQPSPGSQFLGSPVFSDPLESMIVRPGSPQQSPGGPGRLQSPPIYPESPTMFPFPPLESPIRVSSPPKSPRSATKKKKHDLPVSFGHPETSKSPSGPGGPLDISIPVPSSPESATIDTIQDLIDEEQIDFQTSSTLAPQLQDKLDRIRGHSLLVETLQEIVPGDEVEDDSHTKSDVLASMMYSEERGVIETGSSPKKTYNALFGANAALAVSLEGERSITVSPAAPAPLQDIVVPVGQADVDDIAVVSPEMSHFVASTEEMPKGDAYSSSVQNKTSPVRIPVTKAPNTQSTIAHIDEDGGETKYIPRGELEEQKAPWDIDLDSLENLVGAQISLTSPMRSDESITKTMGRFEYILDLERPKHYSCVQLRGTQRPPWFPGYYYVMPHTGSGESPEKDSTLLNYVKQGNNLESVFAEAWNIFKPQTVEEKSEVVLL